MKNICRKSNSKKFSASNYLEKIYSNEDLPLFEDAIKAAKIGALRAAYIMIWLSCAESLKRRFKEAAKRDHSAGRTVGAIKEKEDKHKSVDKFILDRAKCYGFISNSEHTTLTHIYTKRCIYGHPYEEEPSVEDVVYAATKVIEYVLSKPVKLKHSFGEQLIKDLLEEKSYIDNLRESVELFAEGIVPKIDKSICEWLLNKYWKELERFSNDPSLAIFFDREIWFSLSMLMQVGVSVFSHDDWHTKIHQFPHVLMESKRPINLPLNS